MLENLNPKESLEIEEQRKLSELNERRTQELLETAGKVQDDALELLAKLDGTSVEEQREKLEKAMDEVEEGKDDPALISEDGRLNNRQDVSFGSSAYVCARVTTGTQNYCPFAGSGR